MERRAGHWEPEESGPWFKKVKTFAEFILVCQAELVSNETGCLAEAMISLLLAVEGEREKWTNEGITKKESTGSGEMAQ